MPQTHIYHTDTASYDLYVGMTYICVSMKMITNEKWRRIWKEAVLQSLKVVCYHALMHRGLETQGTSARYQISLSKCEPPSNEVQIKPVPAEISYSVTWFQELQRHSNAVRWNHRHTTCFARLSSLGWKPTERKSDHSPLHSTIMQLYLFSFLNNVALNNKRGKFTFPVIRIIHSME
jgi:hypothetical protein